LQEDEMSPPATIRLAAKKVSPTTLSSGHPLIYVTGEVGSLLARRPQRPQMPSPPPSHALLLIIAEECLKDYKDDKRSSADWFE
jgi:hypothetical protein